MRRMWLWILIYALVGGAIMALPTMGVLIIGVMTSAGSGSSLNILTIVSLLNCLGTIGGFSVLMASAILGRGKFTTDISFCICPNSVVRNHSGCPHRAKTQALTRDRKD
jgi:hypothetical protein